MKILITLLLMATMAQAASYSDRALYWCHQNGHEEATQGLTEVINNRADGKKGELAYIAWTFQSWKFAGPSKATLDALDGATVDAWIKDRKDTEEADYDVWTDREKAMLKLLVKEINTLRGLHGLPERTAAQVKAALKAELED